MTNDLSDGVQSFGFVRTELVRERPFSECPLLSTSLEAFEYATKELLPKGADKEYFWSLLLDGKHRLMGVNLVSIGTMTSSLVHPREVFRPAIATGAVALILIHNHPSGDPQPSPEDMEITERMCEIGQLTGIRVLDHVIIGDGCFASCFERGLIH